MLKRLSRFLQADFHAVLDQLEDPEALIKQSLREMDSEIGEQEVRINILQQELDRTRQQIAKCQQALTDSETQLDLCFDSGDDLLARTLLRRKLEWQHQLNSLVESREQTEKCISEAETQLNNCRQRYQSIRQKADVLLEESYSDLPSSTNTHSVVSEEDVEVAWLAEQAKRNKNQGKNKRVAS